MIGIRTSRSAGGSERSRRSSTTTNAASVIDQRALVPRNGQSGLRTLDDVRDQVAQEIAIYTVTKAKVVDGTFLFLILCSEFCSQFPGVRIGVRLSMSKSEDEYFLEQVAANVVHQLTLHEYIFAIGTIAQTTTPTVTSLIIIASKPEYIQRAVLLASPKFLGRVLSEKTIDCTWIVSIQDLGVSSYDEDALWDVLSKAARSPMNPLLPPTGSRGIDQILSEARAKLQRVTPLQAYGELRESQVEAPTFLVDIRSHVEREADGGIDGALLIERNLLEWKFDPRCPSRLAIADRYDLRIIIFCQEGFASRCVVFWAENSRNLPDLHSLAADSLQKMGMLNATDIIGGYEAWKEAGLPITNEPERRKPRSLVSLAGSVV